MEIVTILGLDLGTNSVGWCLLQTHDGKPAAILASGVRAFEAGMDGDIASGKAEPWNLQRRAARQARRQTDRRARRRGKVLGILQRAGLLAPGKAQDVIPAMDRALWARHAAALAPDRANHLAHVLPYWLRTRSLDHPLALDELGRAFYHLAQRRGFLSNKKSRKDAKEQGVVKAGIKRLDGEMGRAGARTIGEYFAGLDPIQHRIRQRYTWRPMFIHEFEAIWAAQQPHHPNVLTEELRRRLSRALFRQRPLKSAKHLVGRCALEPKRRRAPIALLLMQHLRVLQQVNHCRVVVGGTGELRPLTTEERAILAEKLEHEGDQTFAKAKRLLKLSAASEFTIEKGGQDKFLGNRTGVKLAEVFGERWQAMPTAQRDAAVADILSFHSERGLKARAMKAWGLNEASAAKFAAIDLEDGYASLSRRAAAKILPGLQCGLSYAEAVKAAYGEFALTVTPHDLLPPVAILPGLRNPVVSRVLTEVRKVVNHVIRRYGKPSAIRIELARDMRRSQAERMEATKRNRDNERLRLDAAARVAREAGIPAATRDDILKVQLADECNWICPYTGQAISMDDLLGDNPRFDIEHIIPFSRSLDSSFGNLTLCLHEENRHVKRNRTPFEAYGSQGQRWADILDRVARFKGSQARRKLQRFRMETLDSLDDFSARELTDTRYASVLAGTYLSYLYGGLWDAAGTRRIFASRGGVTAHLRHALDLNGIVGQGGEKSRDDHRHHAVDALVIALTDPGTIAELSRRSQQPEARYGRRVTFADFPEPWSGFDADAHKAIDGIVVSHRVAHVVRGRLHEDTNYARVTLPDGKQVFRVRKPLERLGKQVNDIADPIIRDIVKKALNGGLPDKVFADASKHPKINGIFIHTVRVNCNVTAQAVGHGGAARHVSTDTNHHLEVVAELDAQGNEVKWAGHIVDRLDAHRRWRKKQPIVQRDHGVNRRFLFSLHPGDTVRFSPSDGEPTLAVIRSVSRERKGAVNVEFVAISDARKASDSKAGKAWYKRSIDALRRLQCRKLSVSPLGEIAVANE